MIYSINWKKAAVLTVIAVLCLFLAGCFAGRSVRTGVSDTGEADRVETDNMNSPGAGTDSGNKEIHIAMSTDLHYQPEISDAASTLVPQMNQINQLIDCLMDEMAEEQPDVLLLCGDLTNNGLKKEHQGLAEKLDRDRENGTRILVIPGNHDLKGITREEFETIYQDFGYRAPLMKDNSSLSYVTALADNFWILMLDTNISNTDGGITDETLVWIQDVLEQADSSETDVITATHHNLLGHSSSQYNQQYSFENQENLLKLLEQHHVALNISGHLHKQHAAKRKTTSQKNAFYEITGGMLADYPNLYTNLTINQKTRTISYRSQPLDVDSWASEHGYEEDHLLHFSAYSHSSRLKTGAGLVGGMLSSMDISGEELDRLTGFWTAIYMDASDGTIGSTRAGYLASDDYRLWQQYQNKSKYSEWLDFLLGQKGSADSRSLEIPY